MSEALLVQGTILLFASFLQGAVGFGYSLFATPLLLWYGNQLQEVVAIIATSVTIQLIVSLYQVRDAIRWKEVLQATAVRYLSIPVGILALVRLSTLPLDQIRQLVGTMILLVIVIRWSFRIQPRESLHPAWGMLAFSASGFLAGMLSMGGPPAVLWVMAHRWGSREVRAFLFSIFLLGTPLALTLLHHQFGAEIHDELIRGLIFAPAVVLGTLAGVALGGRMKIALLRSVAFGILLLIALVAILGPML